ncbi:MAG: hypothetical protein D6687_10310 [Acidobacteria bacterium]|jgi:hypothetical protein|nr:MAG: hypothetical protein D6687_10310 [Acidobacteriota bacterium]GIU81143.1 MAG: hypothetical protein KatS3mg006_0207 [Pyrinomonadaceae bacterium]
MEKTALSVALAWFCPGLGHILERRIKTGIVVAVTFALMFAIGAANGGLDYPGASISRDSFLLHFLNIFARLGSGLGYIIFLLFGNSSPEAASKITFEYGGRLVEIAGLMNYLMILNCFDISSRRKK